MGDFSRKEKSSFYAGITWILGQLGINAQGEMNDRIERAKQYMGVRVKSLANREFVNRPTRCINCRGIKKNNVTIINEDGRIISSRNYCVFCHSKMDCGYVSYIIDGKLETSCFYCFSQQIFLISIFESSKFIDSRLNVGENRTSLVDYIKSLTEEFFAGGSYKDQSWKSLLNVLIHPKVRELIEFLLTKDLEKILEGEDEDEEWFIDPEDYQFHEEGRCEDLDDPNQCDICIIENEIQEIKDSLLFQLTEEIIDSVEVEPINYKRMMDELRFMQ